MGERVSGRAGGQASERASAGERASDLAGGRVGERVGERASVWVRGLTHFYHWAAAAVGTIAGSTAPTATLQGHRVTMILCKSEYAKEENTPLKTRLQTHRSLRHFPTRGTPLGFE